MRKIASIQSRSVEMCITDLSRAVIESVTEYVSHYIQTHPLPHHQIDGETLSHVGVNVFASNNIIIHINE